MSRVIWDQIGKKKYLAGCDHGVLYPQKGGAYPTGVEWSGLTGVTQNPGGAEENAIYADNIKYLGLLSAETFGCTIECLYYPDEWDQCNGETKVAPGVNIGQQRRNSFAFSWRNNVGNDTDGEDYGYMLHFAYGCKASPSDISNETVNESPDAATLSYTVTTTPVNVEGKDEEGKALKPTAHLTIKSTDVSADVLEIFEAIIYGADADSEVLKKVLGDDADESYSVFAKYFGDDALTKGTEPRLPLPNEIIDFFKAAPQG